MASRLEFRILGPLVVRVDGQPVPAGGPKQRALLALLLLSANRVVSRERLIGELFPEQSVNSADHALRNHVSRLRKVVSPGAGDEPRLVARSPGYLLRLEPGELDLETFERLVAEGQEARAAGDPAAAARAFRAAEALWQGRPLADLEFEPFARIDVDRLEELRLAAVEERIDAELELGRQLALVPELEALGAEHPLRERFRAQLMLALYRSGRQAEGLEVYRETRQLLDDQLGLAPSLELQELERAILLQDPALNVPANGHGRPAPGPERPICPFKGLAPFEASDAEFFFGRERLVDELAARLHDTPLLAVIGASGSGKSSLLRAGLLPALAAGSAHWQQVLIRPGEHPAAEITRALNGELADVLARLAPGQRVVVAVDQFEEVFASSVDEDERRSFLAALADAAWDPDRRATILLALRADFFGRVAPYVELADLVTANHVLLGPMTGGELRRAIEAPAARVGLTVEPALVDTLVDEVAGEAGGLPLLSTALLDLWLARRGRTLALEDYERMGGVRGAVGRHAEAAFQSLDDESRELARRIMVRLAAGGDCEALTRRRVTRSELDADEDERVARVLATLVERRLLVAHDETVELVHEALFEQWPRLAGWLDDDAQGRRLRAHLSHAAADWAGSGRDPSELYRGARLAAALEWAEGTGNEAGLNRLEREFLEESRTAFARESERQRRANQRLRAALAAVLGLLALAAAAGLVALDQRGNARREATAAVAQRLGAQALIEPRLDRSLLLAREGVNLADSVATQSNLLAALLRSPAALAVAQASGNRALDEAISPDGRTLAVRGAGGNVDFFDTRTLGRAGHAYSSGDQIGLMGAIVGPLRALAFSPDGTRLAVGSTTGTEATLDLVDASTHVSRANATDLQLHAADVAYSPDGRTVALGEPTAGNVSPPDEVIVVDDARTGAARASSEPIRAGRLAGYTSDGRFLLVTKGNAASVLLDARMLKPAKTIAGGGVAAVSPRRREAAFGHPDGSMTLVDLRTDRRATLRGRATAGIQAITFSSDGKLLATAAQDGSVAVWDTGRLLETFRGHSAEAQGVVFSPDGRTVYSVGADGAVIAWDVSGVRRLGQTFEFRAKTDDISAASAVSPDGASFATSPDADRVTLWRARTLTRIPGELRGRTGPVDALAFSPDGTLLAAAGNDGAVVWNVAERKISRVLQAQGLGNLSLALSPDGRKLALGRVDGSDVVYDVTTGKELATFAGTGSVGDITFSPDGKVVASVSLDGSAAVWDVQRKQEVAHLTGAVAAYSDGFSPDGKLLAVGDSSGAVVFWDVARRRRVGRTLTGNNGGITDLAFDPGGETLVTSSDGKLRLWDVRTRKLIGAPLQGSDTGGSAAFFPDGKRVLGVFHSGAGVVWNVDPAAWKARACQIAGRNLTRVEWSDFLPERAYRDVCP